ncbi:MAG: hypothetical protein AAB353_13090 [Candidatus Hydrogenedentota bacterium]
MSITPQVTSHAPTKRLGAALVAEKIISEGQLAEALVVQQKEGGFLGRILVDSRAINETTLINFLVKQFKIPHINITEYGINNDLLALVPKEICERYSVLPVDKLGSILTLAMVDPLDVEALAQVRLTCPDLRIKPILCSWRHFEEVSAKVFGTPKKVEAMKEPTGEASLGDFGLSAAPAKKTKPKPAAADAAPVDAPAAMTEEEFRGTVDRIVRAAVNRGVESVTDLIRRQIASSGGLPIEHGSLLNLLNETLGAAINDSTDSLIFQAQQALATTGSTVGSISSDQLDSLVRSAVRQGVNDGMLETVRALSDMLAAVPSHLKLKH